MVQKGDAAAGYQKGQMHSFDDVNPVFVKRKKGESKGERDGTGKKGSGGSLGSLGSSGSLGRRTTRQTVMGLFFGEEKASVSFGEVGVREYRRTVSKEAVPSDGAYPLGLSNEVLNNYTLDFDTFEDRRQQELKQRYAAIVRAQRQPFASPASDPHQHEEPSLMHEQHLSQEQIHTKARRSSVEDIDRNTNSAGSDPSNNPNSASPIPSPDTDTPINFPPGNLETRQFDYARKRASTRAGRFSLKPSLRSYNIIQPKDGNNPLFCVLSEQQRKDILVRDVPEHVCSLQENPEFCVKSSFNAKKISKDLDDLRSLQELDGACGCSCTKLNLFLPSGMDEEHDPRRMPQSQIMEELDKRGLLYDSVKKLPRNEMERILHDRIKSEPCCWGNDCPCVTNGIECQFDSCSCWKTGTMKGMTAVKAKKKCGNEYGLHIVVMSKIKKHRRTTLLEMEEKKHEEEKWFVYGRFIPKMDTIVIGVGIVYFFYIAINRLMPSETPEL